jgi:hypothetical protein
MGFIVKLSSSHSGFRVQTIFLLFRVCHFLLAQDKNESFWARFVRKGSKVRLRASFERWQKGHLRQNFRPQAHANLAGARGQRTYAATRVWSEQERLCSSD